MASITRMEPGNNTSWNVSGVMSRYQRPIRCWSILVLVLVGGDIARGYRGADDAVFEILCIAPQSFYVRVHDPDAFQTDHVRAVRDIGDPQIFEQSKNSLIIFLQIILVGNEQFHLGRQHISLHLRRGAWCLAFGGTQNGAKGNQRRNHGRCLSKSHLNLFSDGKGLRPHVPTLEPHRRREPPVLQRGARHRFASVTLTRRRNEIAYDARRALYRKPRIAQTSVRHFAAWDVTRLRG